MVRREDRITCLEIKAREVSLNQAECAELEGLRTVRDNFVEQHFVDTLFSKERAALKKIKHDVAFLALAKYCQKQRRQQQQPIKLGARLPS